MSNKIDWISVYKKLPPIYHHKLVTWEYGNDRYVTMAKLSRDGASYVWKDIDNHVINVVAWADFPESYKERL